MSCFFGHKWNKWEQYLWASTVNSQSGKQSGPSMGVSQNRQKRICEQCGKMQDEIV